MGSPTCGVSRRLCPHCSGALRLGPCHASCVPTTLLWSLQCSWRFIWAWLNFVGSPRASCWHYHVPASCCLMLTLGKCSSMPRASPCRSYRPVLPPGKAPCLHIPDPSSLHGVLPVPWLCVGTAVPQPGVLLWVSTVPSGTEIPCSATTWHFAPKQP